MSSAPNWIPSKRLQAAARSEQRRIERELARLKKQEAKLRANLAKIEAARSKLAEEMAAVDRFAEPAPEPEGPQLHLVGPPPSERPGLTGAQIREMSVRLIVGTPHADEGIHYKTWFELVTRSGIQISGKDPAAVFLTQMSRSPVVEKTDRPGMYRIDQAFLEKSAREVKELDRQLESLDRPGSDLSVEEIERNRKVAKQILTRKRSLFRAIDEAERSLKE